MSRRVGFLRAVNVGKRRVQMTRVAQIAEALGYDNVWTYINSGNVVFDASGARATIERNLEHEFEKAFGFEVTTFVRTASEVQNVVQVDPFRLNAGDTYYVTFLKHPPSSATAKALEAASNDFDTLVVDGRDVHWRMRGKSIDTTVPKKTWNLLGEHGSTSRNVTMLRKLVAKLDG